MQSVRVMLAALSLLAPSTVALAAPVAPTRDKPATEQRASDKPVAAPVEAKPGERSEEATLLVRPSAGVAGRHFGYADGLSRGLRSYDVPVTPTLGLGAELYPARTLAGLGGLGLFVDYMEAVGLVSERGGEPANAVWRRFDVGVRYRLNVGRGWLLGGRVAYGGSEFHHDGSTRLDTAPVDASYRMLRGGLDARVQVGALAVVAGVDGIKPGDLGPLAVRFPRAEGLGLAARAGVAMRPFRHIELGAQAAYERLAFQLNPEPGDKNVAGGALDEHWRLEANATFFY